MDNKQVFNKNIIYLGKIDFPTIKNQQNLYWDYHKQTKLVIAGAETQAQENFVAAIIKQLLMNDKNCAIIGTANQSIVTNKTLNYQKLLFANKITEIETLLLLLKEANLCLIITDWQSLWQLLKTADLAVLHAFETFLLDSKNIVMVSADANFFNNPLAKYFTAKLVMPFYDKTNQMLAGCSNDSFIDFPEGRARAYNELNTQKLSNTVQLVQSLQETHQETIAPPLKPLAVKVTNKIIYGLENRKLIWNVTDHKTLLIAAHTIPELEHLVLTVVNTIQKNYIYFFDCTDQAELSFPEDCEVLVIEHNDKISPTADVMLIEIMNTGNIAVCASGLVDNLLSCFAKAYQRLKTYHHGIIINPKAAIDGLAVANKINTMPSNIKNRGVYFHPNAGELIIQS
ncbi:MAG: hypothetical protein QM571_06620 [Micrococcaceae bacterium]